MGGLRQRKGETSREFLERRLDQPRVYVPMVEYVVKQKIELTWNVFVPKHYSREDIIQEGLLMGIGHAERKNLGATVRKVK